MFPDVRAAGKQGSEREKIGLVVTVLRVLDAVLRGVRRSARL
jgi:hypothetical protein